MVKVKLLVGRCGPSICDNAGDIVEVSAEEAKRLISTSQAVSVERATNRAKTEKAVK